MNFLVSILPELRSERLSLNRFIAQRKKELGLIREKIGLLREIERLVTAV
jgi:hypothetical protein